MSKKLLAVFCFVAAVSAQTTSKQAKPTGEVKIPAAAVKGEDGNYHYTDEKGKKWIYRNTPFGVAKSEDKDIPVTATPFGKAKVQDKPSEPAPVAAKDTTTVAYDEGDSVRFEQATPFGKSTYTKKKTELTDKERAIVDSQKSKQQ